MIYRSNDAGGIGASCTLLSIDGKNILIDAGISFEKLGRSNIARGPSGGYFKDARIDIIIITHSHTDHIGSLPRFIREHPEAVIIITRQAYDTGLIMLWDALNISTRLSDEHPEIDAVFSELDIQNLVSLGDDRLILLEQAELPAILEDRAFPGWLFGFHPIGHDPGAISIFINPPTDHPVIITGDASAHDQRIVKGRLVPDDEFLQKVLISKKTPVLITEATNGTRVPDMMPLDMDIVVATNYSRELIEQELVRTILDVRDRGGQALLPTFAKGRSSNVALILMEAGLVPHLDGMARKLFLLEVPNARELITQGKIVLIEEGKLGFEHRKSLWAGTDPCGHEFSPIIVPSANLDNGWSTEYARHFVSNDKNAMIFTGHVFNDSTTERIIHLEKGHTIKLYSFVDNRDVVVNVKCEVRHFDLSAHDYRPALVERVRLLRPAHTIIQHCDEPSFIAVAKAIRRLHIGTHIHRGFGLKHIEIN